MNYLNNTDMRTIGMLVFLSLFLWACGGDQKSKEKPRLSRVEPADPYANWADNHGVGPISAFTLPADVDQELAAKGQEVYEAKCTACHKAEKKFIGPAPKGILEKRTPAWVMNMILNPEEMVQKDPMAKQLLIDFNGSPMANQNLTEDEARSVLEYFRTL